MHAGSPFKFRSQSNPYVGMLSTPDIIKYKVPVPLAFVPPNPKYDPRKGSNGKNHNRSVYVADESHFKDILECRRQVYNFNKCVQNNHIDDCIYYLNYLNFNCKLN